MLSNGPVKDEIIGQHQMATSPDTWADAVYFYEGFLIDSQGRISGEGIKRLPREDHTMTPWPTGSPLPRVHSRRRRESPAKPSIRVRAEDVPYAKPRPTAVNGNEKRSLRVAHCRWKSEEQLSPRHKPAALVCLCTHRTLSDGGLPCKQKQHRTNSSVSLNHNPLIPKLDFISWTSDSKKVAVQVVGSDDVMWCNQSAASTNQNALAILRANSTALVTAERNIQSPQHQQQQQQQQEVMQPLTQDKVLIPLLLKDIEDFEAISLMDSRLSENGFCAENEKQADGCCALPGRCWRCCFDHLTYCHGLCLNCPSFWSILFLLIDIPCALCFC